MVQPGADQPGLAGEHNELGTISCTEPGHGPGWLITSCLNLLAAGPLDASDRLAMPQLL